MSDKECIYREDAIKEIRRAAIFNRDAISRDWTVSLFVRSLYGLINRLPAAPVREVVSDTPHIEDAIDAVLAERRRQIKLFGDQSGTPLFEWMSILGEEVGELCEAVNETCFLNKRHPERGGMDNVYKEATQVAAVAIALMEAIDSGFCPNCGADMRTEEGGAT